MTLEGECLAWGEIKQAVILVNPKHKDVLDELERECLRVRAMEVPAAAPHRRPTAEELEAKVAQNKNGHFIPMNKLGPNTSVRRLAKLKRDHPDIAKRVEAGEFRTVAAAILDETGKTPKAWYEAKLAKDVKPIPEPVVGTGQPGPGRGNKTPDSVSGLPAAYGNSADYTRRRLARDRPDLLQKVADGGLSLNQAAVEAGFRKPPKPRPTTPLELPKLDQASEVSFIRKKPSQAATVSS